ncbi:hypothetical protein POM88_048266 [Heracleum sosnowskyi]|uniref:Uncharacterized protein n=1 Tax=Heracleum sosnowskyi TaxID=360622 RepID=A0AAD8GTJ0_9APIA|nr:hypothetical protein POM88_048266 [Heracleum sosnowskyi]
MDPTYNSFAAHLLAFNVKNKLPVFNQYAQEVKGSKNLVEVEVIEGLDKMINQDPRLAILLKSDVVECLVKILEDSSDHVLIQRSAANILSRANIDTCGTIIKEKAVPVLVNLLSSKSRIIVIAVVIRLTQFVCASPDYVSVILNNGALEVVNDIVLRKDMGTTLTNNLAKFMAFVCRAKFIPDKESLALAILDGLLCYGRLGTLLHIERACFALSYLSYERHVGIEQGTINRIITLSCYEDIKLAGAALGVVGNIARWGNSEQIEMLAKHPDILGCLQTSLSCTKPKKFHLEASNIISRLAAQSQSFPQEVRKAGISFSGELAWLSTVSQEIC